MDLQNLLHAWLLKPCKNNLIKSHVHHSLILSVSNNARLHSEKQRGEESEQEKRWEMG